MELTCPTCFRVERREGASRNVVTEGGLRRPPVHEVVARWNVVRDALSGRLPPVVDRCPCGLYLVGAGPWSDVDIEELDVRVRDGRLVGDASAVPKRLRAFANPPWWKPTREALNLPLILFVIAGPVFMLTFMSSFISAYLTYWWHSWVPDFIGY